MINQWYLGEYQYYKYISFEMQSSITQDSLEKNFFEQLKSGDYVDVKHIEGEWKLAKVIDK